MLDEREPSIPSPASGEEDQHLPPIIVRGGPLDETRLLESTHQLDGAVMLDQQLVRELPDRQRRDKAVRLDRQQSLVLLGGETDRPRACLGERPGSAAPRAGMSLRPVTCPLPDPAF